MVCGEITWDEVICWFLSYIIRCGWSDMHQASKWSVICTGSSDLLVLFTGSLDVLLQLDNISWVILWPTKLVALAPDLHDEGSIPSQYLQDSLKMCLFCFGCLALLAFKVHRSNNTVTAFWFFVWQYKRARYALNTAEASETMDVNPEQTSGCLDVLVVSSEQWMDRRQSAE
jgi:hypothetical protein